MFIDTTKFVPNLFDVNQSLRMAKWPNSNGYFTQPDSKKQISEVDRVLKYIRRTSLDSHEYNIVSLNINYNITYS